MTTYTIPNAAALKSMLAMMFGDDLEVSKAPDGNPAGRFAATYVADGGEIVAICACDDAFVAYTGAALTMMPKDVADEMLKDGNFSDVVLGNFHEIMNICSRLLMSDSSPHLRLDKTLSPADAEKPIAQLAGGARAEHFALSVPRYGQGSLSFMTA